MSSSPTPSNESLGGGSGGGGHHLPVGVLLGSLMVEPEVGGGLLQSSSSSSTCSSSIAAVMRPAGLSSSFLGPIGGPPSSQCSGGSSGDSNRPLSPPAGVGVGVIKCKVCDETFQRPKVLPCLHTFCEDCLEKSFEDDHITCPTCRMECQLSAQVKFNLK